MQYRKKKQKKNEKAVNFGQRLKVLLDKLPCTENVFAKKAGLSEFTIYRTVRGETYLRADNRKLVAQTLAKFLKLNDKEDSDDVRHIIDYLQGDRADIGVFKKEQKRGEETEKQEGLAEEGEENAIELSKQWNQRADFWEAFRREAEAETLSLLDSKKLTNYVKRENIEDDLFKDFIDNSQKTCLAVVGNAGKGKTTFLHHLCAERLNKGNITVLIDYSSMHATIEGRLKEFFTRVSGKNEWDLENFLEEVNGYARARSNHFLIFVDAIDRFRSEDVESEDLYSAPQRLLREVDDLIRVIERVSTLTQQNFSGIKIVLTCRMRVWEEITIGVDLMERRYYGQKDQLFVLLEEFNDSELENALNIYLGERAERLSPTSRRICRDPYMLNVIATVYKEELPEEILSWDLMEVYLTKFIAFHNRDEILRLASLMLRRKVDVVDRLKWDPYLLDIINEGMMEKRRGLELVGFKEERFFEFLIARILIDEVGGAFNKANVLRIIEESVLFRYLQPAIVMALANKGWNEDLLYQLTKVEEYRVREVITDVLTSKGIEQQQYIENLLSRWLPRDERAATIAVQVAYNLGLFNILHESLNSKSEQIRAVGIQYVCYSVRKNKKAVLEILGDLNTRIQQLRNFRKTPTMFESYTIISASVFADQFSDTETVGFLRSGWRDLLNKLCGSKWKRAIFLLVVNRLLWKLGGPSQGSGGFYVKDSSYIDSVGAFFISPASSQKKMLVAKFAPYISLEKTDIQNITDDVVLASTMLDGWLLFGLWHLFAAQATLGLERLLPIFRRLGKENQNSLELAFCLIMFAERLAPDSKAKEEVFNLYSPTLRVSV